jgi:hypothetical protein
MTFRVAFPQREVLRFLIPPLHRSVPLDPHSVEDGAECCTLRREGLIVGSEEMSEDALALPVRNVQTFEFLHSILDRAAGVSELRCDSTSLDCASRYVIRLQIGIYDGPSVALVLSCLRSGLEWLVTSRFEQRDVPVALESIQED